MSVAISWANKMQLVKCDIMVGFPISSHICCSLCTKMKFIGGGGIDLPSEACLYDPRHPAHTLVSEVKNLYR